MWVIFVLIIITIRFVELAHWILLRFLKCLRNELGILRRGRYSSKHVKLPFKHWSNMFIKITTIINMYMSISLKITFIITKSSYLIFKLYPRSTIVFILITSLNHVTLAVKFNLSCVCFSVYGAQSSHLERMKIALQAYRNEYTVMRPWTVRT